MVKYLHQMPIWEFNPGLLELAKHLEQLGGSENSSALGEKGGQTQQTALFEAHKVKSVPAVIYQQPLARVLPLSRLANLARPRDYLIPKRLVGKVCPGGKVRVPLAGKLTDAWVLEILTGGEYFHPLEPISRVTSSLPVLDLGTWKLVEKTAQRYGGTLSSILSQALVPRHRTEEVAFLKQHPDLDFADDKATKLPVIDRGKVTGIAKEAAGGAADNRKEDAGAGADNGKTEVGGDTGKQEVAPYLVAGPQNRSGQAEIGLADFDNFDSFYRLLRAGKTLRTWWQPAPEPGTCAPFRQIAQLLETAPAQGSQMVLFAQASMADQFFQYLDEYCPWSASRSPVLLHAKLPSNLRYRNYLKARFGQTSLIIGARSAVFTPLPKLKLILVWDPDSDSYQEKTHPYWQVRSVVMDRSQLEDCSLVLASFSRSVETQALLDSNWASVLQLPRNKARGCWPRLFVPALENHLVDQGPYQLRIPPSAMQLIERSLPQGAVIVQIPRRGGANFLKCAYCSQRLRCRNCGGPLRESVSGLECGWCKDRFEQWNCSTCGSKRFKRYQLGVQHTAKQLHRAFPQVKCQVLQSGEENTYLSGESSLVVCTPGAEVPVPEGYQAGVIFDAHTLLGLDQLWVEGEALRRWKNLASLVKPSGAVMLLGEVPPLLADAFRFQREEPWARAELRERAEFGFSPCATLVKLQGSAPGLKRFLNGADFSFCQVIGPQSDNGTDYVIMRTELSNRRRLTDLLRDLAAQAVAKKWPQVRIIVDPVEI